MNLNDWTTQKRHCQALCYGQGDLAEVTYRHVMHSDGVHVYVLVMFIQLGVYWYKGRGYTVLKVQNNLT